MDKIKEVNEHKNTKIHPYLSIFTSDRYAYMFLRETKIFKSVIDCSSCSSIMYLNKTDYHEEGFFKCQNKNCKNKRTNKSNSLFEGVRINSSQITRVIYCILYEYNLIQGTSLCNISKPTYIRLKDIILSNLDMENKRIGGLGYDVQIDETAICNGLIIKNPSNTLDTKSSIQWIVGGIDNTPEKNFFLVIVPNRKSTTLLQIFNEKIKKGSRIITDGYPSYPNAVKDFGAEHKIVNHVEGFVNTEGFHTNNIENLWSHLKKDFRERAGVNKTRIQIFLKEFEWLKKI